MRRGGHRDEVTAPDRFSLASRAGPEGMSAPYSLLVFERDESSVFRLPREGTILIGRSSECDLVLDDRGVSSRHAELTLDDGIALTDLASKNGTRVNGQRIDDRVVLVAGDLVTISSVTLLLRAGHAPAIEREPVALVEFRRRAEEELDRAIRYKRNLTLTCLTFDPPRRDRGSIETALKRILRGMDLVSWSERGELLVLMPELSAEDAFAVVGRMTEELEPEQPIAHLGFATYPTDGYDVESLLVGARSKQLSAPADSSGAMKRPFRTFDLGGHSAVVADSAMLRVYGMVEHVATSPLPVLIQGETGTGKELVARAVHHWSTRRDGPFVAVNCAALTESLIGSELFGHERGSFTGAVEAHAGVFERAHAGTVLLDEVAELPLAVQAKLLRVLETKRVIRIGGSRELEVDFRIVAATNRDLEARVQDGRFRRDLFYRLGGATVWLPPLRERQHELPILAQLFLDGACRASGRPPKQLASDALAALARHAWPGNVRELKNAMEYLASTVSAALIDESHLAGRPTIGSGAPGRTGSNRPSAAGEQQLSPADRRPLYEEIAELERRRIESALQETAGNQTKAADRLCIPLRTLQSKVRQYGLGRGGRRRRGERATHSPGSSTFDVIAREPVGPAVDPEQGED